eukprot:4134919-Prymnesium_polylepis.1
MCLRQGAGDRMCTAVPARCRPRHRAGMSMCRPPPSIPPARTEAMSMTHVVAAWPPEPAQGCCGG